MRINFPGRPIFIQLVPAEEEATKPNSRVSVDEMADHAYGAPRLTWMANAGTNLREEGANNKRSMAP